MTGTEQKYPKWVCSRDLGIFVVKDENGEVVAGDTSKGYAVRLALLVAALRGIAVKIIDRCE